MRDIRIWLAVGGLVLGGWLISSGLSSSNHSAPVTDDELETAVFVCRESGEIFVGKVRPTPAKHPVTGRETLMPGLYSPDKENWIAGPSFEELQRSQTAFAAGKSKSKLLREGPVPDNATRI